MLGFSAGEGSNKRHVKPPLGCQIGCQILLAEGRKGEKGQVKIGHVLKPLL